MTFRHLVRLFFLLFSSAITTPLFCIEAPDICIVLPLRNDVDVLRECLDSICGFGNQLFICDCGASDEAKDVLNDFLVDSDISTIIFEGSPDRENDKNYAIKMTQKYLKEKGCNLETTYLLVLDPGLVVKGKEGFPVNSLKSDAHLLLQKKHSLGLQEYHLNLLRASIDWHANDIWEQNWESHASFQYEKLYSLTLEERGSDTYWKKKWLSEVDRLTDLLEDDPEHPTYAFFLAQVFKGLKYYDDAIYWFQIRLNSPEESEQVWFSKFMIGQCHEELGNWDQALYWYLEAFQHNPTRVDPLSKLATQYRYYGRNNIAHLFAKHGARIPFPGDQHLFSSPCYEAFQCDEEVAIAAFYTAYQEDGYLASHHLTLRRNVPWFIRDQAYRNYLFYAQNIQNAHFQSIEFDRPLIQEGCEERFHPMNPTLYKTETGYKVICRTVNYTQKDAKMYQTVDDSGVFRTRNFLLEYDQGFNLLSQHEIVEDLERDHYPRFNVFGLDDCRIFEWNDETWFTCNTSDTNPQGTFQISLCKLGDPEANGEVQVESLTPLFGPDPYRCEKNWLPFVKEGELYAIYSFDPFTIYKPDTFTGECPTVLSYDPFPNFSAFRGSAGPIPFENGYLTIVHEVVFQPTYERRYLHRLVYLDKEFLPKRVSKSFTFTHIGIEYCCGMVKDHLEENIVFTIGLEDHEAQFCIVDIQTIKQMLLPLPQWCAE